MSDTVVIPTFVVERLRGKAKKRHRETGIAHHAALDAVAQEGGVEFLLARYGSSRGFPLVLSNAEPVMRLAHYRQGKEMQAIH